MSGEIGLIALLDAVPWLGALGLSLLHFLWQGVLIGALYYLIRALLPPAHSEWRYTIGLGALGALVACPIVTFLILVQDGGSSGSSLAGVALPLSEMAMTASPPATAGWQGGLILLVAGWITGVVFMSLRAFRDWRGLARIARQMAERHLDMERRLVFLARRLQVMQNVRVLVSAHVDTPSLIGWLRPVILLPSAIVLGMPRHQLELILSHELGHLKRCDHLVNLIQAVIETLLFYHPVVHWISRDVRHEREICCDRLVLRASGNEPREYARALATLEEMRQVPARLALGANGGLLIDRVRRIVGVPVPRMAATRSATGAWLLAATGVAALAISMQLRHVDQDPAPSLRSVAAALPEAAGLAGLALRMASSTSDETNPARVQAVASPAPTRPEVAGIDAPIASSAPASVEIPLPPPSRKFAARLDRTAVVAPAEWAAPDLVAVASTTPLGHFDVAASAAPETLPAADALPARRSDPVVLRKVAPQYPAGSVPGREVRVEIAFGIDDRGRVRDLRVLEGRSEQAFAQAATDALRAWRFDPASVPAESTLRFRQTFVFARTGAANGEPGSDDCLTRTGSRICQ
jgi:TonB family protein